MKYFLQSKPLKKAMQPMRPVSGNDLTTVKGKEEMMIVNHFGNNLNGLISVLPRSVQLPVVKAIHVILSGGSVSEGQQTAEGSTEGSALDFTNPAGSALDFTNPAGSALDFIRTLLIGLALNGYAMATS